MSIIKWVSDPSHSSISFKVRHLMISTVTGHFEKFTVEVNTETEDFNTAFSIAFTAETGSVKTNSEDRDKHLKSSEFFYAEKFPQIKFESSFYQSDGDDEAQMKGNLTVRGVTKPVVLSVDFGGVVVDPYGQTKAGFSIETKLSRKEFGLVWDTVTETGSVLVGDEVKIYGEIQLIKQ